MEKREIHGNHFNDISRLPEYIRWIGGPERWRSIQLYMEQAEARLEPCPHCGGQAILNGGWAYASPEAKLVCTGCGCGAGRVGIGSIAFGTTIKTLEDCIDLLVSRWNARREAQA